MGGVPSGLGTSDAATLVVALRIANATAATKRLGLRDLELAGGGGGGAQRGMETYSMQRVVQFDLHRSVQSSEKMATCTNGSACYASRGDSTKWL